MSKIEELIAQYCPEGVKCQKFGEVAVIQRGASPRPIQRFLTDEINGVPWIKIGDTKTRSKYVIDTAQRITADGAKKSRVLKKGDFIISNSMSYGRPYILGIDGAIHDGWASISDFSDSLNSDFLYHFLTSNVVQDYWDSKINSGSVSNLNADIIKSLSIPIPPLPVQEEIVNILDKFTALEAELEAELEARKRQYEYYRNELLAFEGKDVEWKTLGEIGEFIRGKRFVRTDMIEDGFPCIHYGEMYTHYNVYATESKSFISDELARKLRVASTGDVIIVAAGETTEDIGKATAWLGTSDVVIHDACFTFKSELNPKFVAYFSRTKLFHDQIKKHISSGKISAINAKGLEKAKIPIPPLEEQKRIVTILDKFDALVNDISEGLPAEIAARRQQYEYYRGKLLTFEPLAVAQ